MALGKGSQFGPYSVIGLLGAGGMGEVYRAHDTKLGRDVAIKILPSALAEDEDRLARFEREAKLLATLNHPHIAVVYGLDEVAGTSVSRRRSRARQATRARPAHRRFRPRTAERGTRIRAASASWSSAIRPGQSTPSPRVPRSTWC